MLAMLPHAILALTITEANLNWFGNRGETRAPTIKSFFQQEELMADVMAFEEIVDINLLKRGVLAERYDCHSYDRNGNHQFVVICNKKGLRFEPADGNGFALEAVDVTGHLRPAVHGILKTAAGRRLAHVFAVHLKAMPEFSEVRMSQVGKLVDYLAAAAKSDPVILLGDFNTFADDPERMDAAFAAIGLEQLELPEAYTWASATESYPPAKFDRVWMSPSLLRKVQDKRVVGPCNDADQATLKKYNKEVSDHCPVALRMEP